MNKRQKTLLVNFISVLFVTAVFIAGMTHLRDWLNRSEAMRAMKIMAQAISGYREKNGSLPPESYLGPIRSQLVRLGEFQYRAQWIDFESPPDTILAYTRREFRSELIKSGYVVLRLSGKVEWMEKKEFEDLLRSQQSQSEIQVLQEKINKGL